MAEFSVSCLSPRYREFFFPWAILIWIRSLYPVGWAAGARRPAEAGPWGLSEGSLYRLRGCASGMGMWAC